MERDGAAAAAVGVDAQGDLLRHRPARHPDGRLLAEQLGDPRLEPLGQLAGPVPVDGSAPRVAGCMPNATRSRPCHASRHCPCRAL